MVDRGFRNEVISVVLPLLNVLTVINKEDIRKESSTLGPKFTVKKTEQNVTKVF